MTPTYLECQPCPTSSGMGNGSPNTLFLHKVSRTHYQKESNLLICCQIFSPPSLLPFLLSLSLSFLSPLLLSSSSLPFLILSSFPSCPSFFLSPISSPQSLRRRSSITGKTRPLNLAVPKRASSLRRASSLSRHSGEGPSIYLSKETVSRLSRNLEHQDSLSWEDTSRMLYNSSKQKGREGVGKDGKRERDGGIASHKLK